MGVEGSTAGQVTGVLRLLLSGITGLVLATAPALALPVDVVTVETYEPIADPDWVGPYFGNTPLAAGELYLVTIRGTFSIWYPETWTAPAGYSGAAEPAPLYSSPDVPNGMVGVDAENWFAVPNMYYGGSPLPSHQPFLQRSLDGGVSWGHYEGLSDGCRADHAYWYLVVGDGHPIGFRFVDAYPADNYGLLVATVEAGTTVVCHVPPGNPSAARVTRVEIGELQSHLAHGDCWAPSDSHPGTVCSCPPGE